MLDQLGELIRRHGLVRTIPEGTRIYRCRTHKSDETPATAKALDGANGGILHDLTAATAPLS